MAPAHDQNNQTIMPIFNKRCSSLIFCASLYWAKNTTMHSMFNPAKRGYLLTRIISQYKRHDYMYHEDTGHF